MRVSMTGSAGFIGSALTKELIKQGHYVRSCDVIPKKANPQFEYFFQGDFTDEKTCENLVKGTDVCVHMGAVANLNWARQHPSETININVLGTAKVAEACGKYQIPMLYISTCCCYGETNIHPTPEHGAEMNPTEIYGCNKYAGEQVVKGISSLNNGFPYRILRYSTVYGPGMREALATYIFSEKALTGKPLPIHGTGMQTRSFVYIDDLVYATMQAIQKPLKNDIINIAGSENLSVLDIAHTCLDIAGIPRRQHAAHLNFVTDRPGQVMKEWILIKEAEKTLHWKPQTKFKYGMTIAMNWVKKRVG